MIAHHFRNSVHVLNHVNQQAFIWNLDLVVISSKSTRWFIRNSHLALPGTKVHSVTANTWELSCSQGMLCLYRISAKKRYLQMLHAPKNLPSFCILSYATKVLQIFTVWGLHLVPDEYIKAGKRKRGVQCEKIIEINLSEMHIWKEMSQYAWFWNSSHCRAGAEPLASWDLASNIKPCGV